MTDHLMAKGRDSNEKPRNKDVLRVRLEFGQFDDLINRLSLSSQEVVSHSPVAKVVLNKKLDLSTELDAKPFPEMPVNSLKVDPLCKLSSSSGGEVADGVTDSDGSLSIPQCIWSPGKISPSWRGRNLKEYEEQLERLKKENFALKLRIYFLEERMGFKAFPTEENLHKANIELKVEAEALKKELCDKQELVREALSLLSALEEKFQAQLEEEKELHQKDTEHLRKRVALLEKELEAAQNLLHNRDLSQLCGLAFNAELPENMKPNKALSTDSDGEAGIVMPNEGESEARIRELEGHVLELEKKINEKAKVSEGLEEDISNLKRELDEKEDKLVDLEQEVAEKDLRVDQLMQDLETRHREIEDKESTIQTLHNDLNKVEPEIEIKVQEIIERDRIIEEKIEQLQQQNKILVEIQITLDEKQKQIAELESTLSEVQQNAQKLTKEFEFSCETVQGLACEIVNRDKEIASLKKELKKKEKKIRDLVAELKESLDMLKKAKWEAETSGGEDGVKEMVEEENERLWAELEQKKLDLLTLESEKETALMEAENRIRQLQEAVVDSETRLRNFEGPLHSRAGDSEARHLEGPLHSRAGDSEARLKNLEGPLHSRAGDSEARLRNLEGLLHSRVGDSEARLRNLEGLLHCRAGDSDAVKSQLEVMELKEKLRSRNELLRNHQSVIDGLRGELSQMKELLAEKKQDINGMKEELLKRNGDAQDLLTKELLGKSVEVQKLQDKLCRGFPIMQDRQLQTLKLYIETKSLQDNLGDSSASSQTRSSSTSKLAKKLPEQRGSRSSSKNRRSNSLSLLENATDTKRLLSQDRGPKKDVDVFSNTESDMERDLASSGKGDIERDLASSGKGDIERDLASSGKGDIERDLASSGKGLVERDLSSSGKGDMERDLSSSGKGYSRELGNEVMSEEETSLLSCYQRQIAALKRELETLKGKLPAQLLEAASERYQESIKNLKEEIISLRKRLADSHNACDLLRTRLEELVDFMEQVLEMDRKGIINLSHLSASGRASLQKTLDESRSLSHSLSHSLMIGTDQTEGGELDVYSPNFHLSVKDDTCLEDADEALNSSFSSDGGSLYNSFAAKISSQIEAKIQDMDAIALKLGHLGSIIEEKENMVKSQAVSIVKLESRVSKLVEELKIKNKLLSEMKNSNDSIQVQRSVPLQLNLAAAGSGPEVGIPIPPLLPPKKETRGSKENDVAIVQSSYSTDGKPKTSARGNSEASCEGGGSLSQPLPQATIAAASPSESEAWSEPDRNVSLARIGLDVCNLITDRSLSRSRVTRSVQFTSESEGECVCEEGKEGSGAAKTKRRSDAAEVKRLTSKLKTLEQLNETLRAEMHIYQTLNQQIDKAYRPPKSSTKSVASDEGPVEDETSIIIPSHLLQEIRNLRIKLEEAITNNDLLRDQLEAALAGYLSEETQKVTSKLLAVQQELKLYQEKMITSAATEQVLRCQLRENENRAFELSERLAEYMRTSQDLEKQKVQLSEDLRGKKETLGNMEAELSNLRLSNRYLEQELESKKVQNELLAGELAAADLEMEKLRSSDVRREVELKRLELLLSNLEKTKVELQEKEADFCAKLQNAVRESEKKVLRVTKERFALMGEKTRLEAKLASAVTQNELLQQEVRELSKDGSPFDLEMKLSAAKLRLQELQKGSTTEKNAMWKELLLLQEEVSSLRSRHFPSDRDSTSFPDQSILQERIAVMKEKQETLLNEKRKLEERYEELENKFKEHEAKCLELSNLLETERCHARALQMQVTRLKTSSECVVEVTSAESSSSAESIPGGDKKKARFPEGELGKRMRGSWRDNKENVAPNSGADEGESPDLGIGSDSLFSSLERLGDQRMHKLCSEESHTYLLSENAEMKSQLASLKTSLKDTASQLAKANVRKDSVERAICRQLTKTHDVLKKASGNLKKANGSGR